MFVKLKGDFMKSFLKVFFAVYGLTFLGFAANANTESFRQTCQVRYETSYEIQADCLDTIGNYIYNDYRRGYCAGDLANINGTLVCSSAHGNWPPPPPPPSYGRLPGGSYLQTCQSCTVYGASLQCTCEDVYSNWHNTYLNFQGCRGDIANINGRLNCAR